MNNTSAIYKVNVVTARDTISKIVVFYGQSGDTPETMTALFQTDPDSERLLDRRTATPIFSASERSFIKKHAITVEFVQHQIHIDDTILSIKLKILLAMGADIGGIEEMYMFCLKSENITPDDFYRVLTQHKRVPLTVPRMMNALDNFKAGNDVFESMPVEVDETKEYQTYDDLLSLNIFNKELPTVKMLGQKLFIVDDHYPFSHNPFDIRFYDPVLHSATGKAITTANNNILMDNGAIIDNNIYLCMAQDVLARKRDPAVSDTYLISVYYPLLKDSAVSTAATLFDKRASLLDNTAKLLGTDTKNTFTKEDMMRSIADTQSTSDRFKYTAQGIVEIKLALHQKFSMKVPLDTLFKLIPTSAAVPMTKLNPSPHRENNYRIYCDQLSTDGRMIPLLSRLTVLHAMNNMGKSKGVSAYFTVDKNTYVVCDFLENGDVVAYIRLQEPRGVTAITDIALQYINPLIAHISDYFVQSGYTFNQFETLYSENVEVVHMQYGFIVEVGSAAPEIDIISVQNCINPIFVVGSTDIHRVSTTSSGAASLSRGIELRYRKVSNFNKMTSREAFVIEQIKRRDGFQGDALIENIMANYSVTDDAARELVAKIATELTIDAGGIGTKTARVRTNPGFVTNIVDVTKQGLRSKSRIRIDVRGIDSVHYISSLQTYIDGLLRLLFDREAVAIAHPLVNEVCALIQTGDVRTKDVVAMNENTLMCNQHLTFDGDDVVVEDAAPITFDNVGPPGSGNAPVVSALSLLYGDGDDDFSDYDEDESQGDAMRGGAPAAKSTKPAKPVGMRLKKPSPFMEMMDNMEPNLFLKKKDGKYDRYSRSCDAAYGRQPVLITTEEHSSMVSAERDGIIARFGEDKFDALGPEEQAEVIKKETQLDDRYSTTYGTDDTKKYTYVCPRYWCLKTNTFVHPNEMRQRVDEFGSPMTNDSGDPVLEHPTCGGVIPRGQDRVLDDGNFVFEFTGESRKSKDGQYAPQQPGFLPRNKHPTGSCIPCCFKLKVNKSDSSVTLSEEQSIRRRDCTGVHDEDGAQRVTGPAKVSTVDAYIMDQNAFPLAPGRWGFLPIEIQYFLKEYVNNYHASPHNTQLKDNTLAIMRHGVEPNTDQAFLAAMADVMFYESSHVKKSVSEFKEYIVNTITLDRFAGYQNGNLVTNFLPTVPAADVDISEHTSSPLYISSRRGAGDDYSSFKNLVAAFNNFIAFLKSDTSVIDHTYLWDFMCAANTHASHPAGINLVVLSIPEVDATTNVDIICPSNHYSTTLFSLEKPSVILVKRGNDYEPVYSFKRSSGVAGASTIAIQKYFATENMSVPRVTTDMTPKTVLFALEKIINPIYQKKCSPIQNMRREYAFRRPILLGELYGVLTAPNEKTRARILKQAMNYSFKTIGLLVVIANIEGYIPCYPSAPLSDPAVETTFMDDETLYRSYAKTVLFDNLVIHHYKAAIPIQPAFKIVDDEVVVGLLTITDQFILLSEPIALSSTNDDIPVLRHKGFIADPLRPARSALDADIATNTSVDDDRTSYVNKIKMETNFFNAFRNTVRVLLNEYINLGIRTIIEETIHNTFMLYSRKLSIVTEQIKQLTQDTVRFSDTIDTSVLQNVSVCINNSDRQCVDSNPVCMMDDSAPRCIIVIPGHSLISPEVSNESVYVSKVADQLIRYARIRMYMLDTSQFLTFSDVRYNLSDREMIVPQSVLKNSYFTDLVPKKKSAGSYDTRNAYDEVNPIISHVSAPAETTYKYDSVAQIPEPYKAKKLVQTKVKSIKVSKLSLPPRQLIGDDI